VRIRRYILFCVSSIYTQKYNIAPIEILHTNNTTKKYEDSIDDYGCLYYYDCITKDKYIIQKKYKQELKILTVA